MNRQNWLDRLGDLLQTSAGSLLKSGSETRKPTKNFLNRVWLGHLAHLAITDMPMGAWTCTTVFAAVASLGNDRSLDRAADTALATGLAGAVGSAVKALTADRKRCGIRACGRRARSW